MNLKRQCSGRTKKNLLRDRFILNYFTGTRELRLLYQDNHKFRFLYIYIYHQIFPSLRVSRRIHTLRTKLVLIEPSFRFYCLPIFDTQEDQTRGYSLTKQWSIPFRQGPRRRGPWSEVDGVKWILRDLQVEPPRTEGVGNEKVERSSREQSFYGRKVKLV